MKTARRTVVADVCCYSGTEWQQSVALVHLFGEHWSGAIADLSRIVQHIAVFLAYSIGQTIEEAHTVVGLDVGIQLRDQQGRPIVYHRDLTEGIWVGEREADLVARMTTKNGDWMAPDCRVSQGAPRFTHVSLDARAGNERIGAAIHWWARVADTLWHSAWPEGPVLSPDATPGEPRDGGTIERRHERNCGGEAWSWHAETIFALVRELRHSGWHHSDVMRSVYRLQATSESRCPTRQIRRRLRAIKWFLETVSREHASQSALVDETGERGGMAVGSR